MVGFNINYLSHYVRPDWFDANTRVTTVQSLRDPDNRNSLENQVIHFRVLSCTMGPNGGQGNTRITWHDRAGGQRRRVQGTMPYNRYFMCADINNPPHCFAIITRSSTDSVALLRHTHGECIVGSDFYIHEPDLVTTYLGDHTPILPHKNRHFFPLVNRCVNLLGQAVNLNMLALRSGQAGYFVLKNKEITLSRCSLVQETTCNGIMCDRQHERGECSCIYTQGASNSYVYSFDVSTTMPREITGDPIMNVCENMT